MVIAASPSRLTYLMHLTHLMRAISRPCARLAPALLAILAVAAMAQPVRKAPPPAFELITQAEASRERELRPKNEALDTPEVRPRSLGGAAAAAPAQPVLAIRVVVPTSQAAVTAPLRIELSFETPPGTRVVPSTFRVLYGVLKIDLTERLRRFSTINERGVVVDQAVVPDGLHRLFLQVADDKGNVAEQELRLRVGLTS